MPSYCPHPYPTWSTFPFPIHLPPAFMTFCVVCAPLGLTMAVCVAMKLSKGA